MELTAVLTPAEEGGYIALNPETSTTTQGETAEEAVANLTEATTLYLSEFPLASRGQRRLATQVDAAQWGSSLGGTGQKIKVRTPRPSVPGSRRNV